MNEATGLVNLYFYGINHEAEEEFHGQVKESLGNQFYLISKFSWKTRTEISEAGITPLEIAPITIMADWQFFRDRESLSQFLKRSTEDGGEGDPDQIKIVRLHPASGKMQ